jgi:hypothetical protein
MANSLCTHLLMTTLRLFPGFLLPRGRNLRKLTPALLPIRLTRGLGLGVGAGWVLPCFLSLLTRGRGRGVGVRDTGKGVETRLN